ncbi:MAG: hypothetical protein C4527_27510 [Candidatus Omnitrophota bacterium]|jgi:hypothetical protein|nr:MAG: hypothetical protein C4527_27510 [Candidatus Omnitrophota bacterium]
MKPQPLEKHEWKWIERFDRGIPPGDGADEKNAFQAYRRIREELRALEVPLVDPHSMIPRLHERLISGSGFFHRWDRWMDRIPAPVFAAVCALLWLAGGISLYSMVSPRLYGHAESVSHAIFQPVGSNESTSLPFLWNYRLRQGCFVTTPPGVTANLTLADGSIVTCSPETQFSINFARDRLVGLRSGSLSVHAASLPGSTFAVATPLGRVEVTGTVFHIKIKRANVLTNEES